MCDCLFWTIIIIIKHNNRPLYYVLIYHDVIYII